MEMIWDDDQLNANFEGVCRRKQGPQDTWEYMVTSNGTVWHPADPSLTWRGSAGQIGIEMDSDCWRN